MNHTEELVLLPRFSTTNHLGWLAAVGAYYGHGGGDGGNALGPAGSFPSLEPKLS